MQRPLIVWLALTLASALAAEELKFPTTQPTEPQNAAKTFHVLDGFQMQLIAAEPLVTDPVSITYDEDGRAYVCEMNDYPYTDKEHHRHAQENPTDQPIGKVRLLTDTDGDGVFDKATVFAEGLSWPTGAACWKGGIFVTATPDVWYLKDTNGDGVADVRQRVFTGFKKLNVQAVMNNPIWGLDHRIYVAGGSNGGEIQRVPGSESVMPMPADFKSLPIKRNDFSFDPSTGDVRLESGGARFGNTFDDWGNRFLCNIRNPCQHVVLPYRYLARNPYLVVPSALNDCAEAGDQLPVYRTSPSEPWREFRAKRWVQEGSTLPKSELVGAGVVTSSAGITVYRGDAYPPEYRDFAFVADVAGNLFYRMKLVPDGVTFKAVQVDGSKNFCTSDDLWCRPVNFVNAPDGCLHVCDMYREVIEHPWSIPDDIHAAIDLLRGRDKGRLWRLVPRQAKQSGPLSPLSGAPQSPFKPRPTPKLSTFTTPDLVALLDHPNAWHRETAQRLLFEQQDKAAVEPLLKLTQDAKTSQGILSALWTVIKLSGVLDVSYSSTNDTQQKTFAVLRNALEGDDEHVIAQAALIADEPLIGLSEIQRGILAFNIQRLIAKHPQWMPAILALETAPPDIVVKNSALLLDAASQDRWLQPLIINACVKVNLVRLATVAFNPHDKSSKARARMFPVLVEAAAGSADKKIANRAFELPMQLDKLDKESSDDPIVLNGLGQTAALAVPIGALKRGYKLADVSVGPECLVWWQDRIAKVVQANPEVGFDQQDIELLALLPVSKASTALLRALSPSQSAETQLTAVEALGAYREPIVADILLNAWPKLTPPIREKATALLLSRTDRIAKLLDAIEAKKILPSQLSAAAKATLGRQKTPALVERITKLIGDDRSSNRKEVITKYEPVLSMTGDPANGAKIYETLCMVCHRHLDRGNDVGPNLGTIKSWTAEQILTNVLDPNREVSPNFALYIVETNDGRTLSGLITSETAGNLTLKRADGGTDTVLRSEIKSLTSPGISLMPEGLEAAITPQQMADLISYLKVP